MTEEGNNSEQPDSHAADRFAAAEDAPSAEETEVGAADVGQGSSEPVEEQDGESELDRARRSADGYLDELKRERASFINYRRRMEQEREGWSRAAVAGLILGLLPVLDDFERARASIPAELNETDAQWVDGLKAVERRLYATLEAAGLKDVEALGATFDPSIHEAVAVAEAEEGRQGTVVEEFRKGYLLGERVLRPSMVKVAQ
ncbi:MAG: nucleotide exchange factor GrpE [Chloroflexia bacterium]